MHLSVFAVAKKAVAKAPKRHTECCPSRVSVNGAWIIGSEVLSLYVVYVRSHARFARNCHSGRAHFTKITPKRQHAVRCSMPSMPRERRSVLSKPGSID